MNNETNTTVTVAEKEAEILAVAEMLEAPTEKRNGPVQREETETKRPKRPGKKASAASTEEEGEVQMLDTSNRRIISTSGHKRVITELDRRNAAHLELVQSAKTGIILTGVVEGVEQYGPNIVAAVLHHGPFKVVIPAEAFSEDYPEFRPEMGYRSELAMRKIMLEKRLGSEIDYIVLGEVNTEEDVAMASRIAAMKRIKNARYIRRDPQGNRYVYEGAIAEARVQVVTRSGAHVEIQGVETFVPLEHLSYARYRDANDILSVGEIKAAKILSIDIDEESGNVTLKASLKEAEENPQRRLLPQLQKNGVYQGQVTVVSVHGVFVKLENGCECLCKYPSFGNSPVIGSKVRVKITSINDKTLRVMGTLNSVLPPR
jgi:predicted RNA-binding protein with RPS1 domain